MRLRFNSRNELFHCESILSEGVSKDDISGFFIERNTGQGLAKYLKFWAYEDSVNNRSKTYLILDNDSNEIVAYFTLKAGMMLENVQFRRFDTVPGIELMNFAVNDGYRIYHPESRHIGEVVFREFIWPLCQELASYVGAEILFLYALPYEPLMDYYSRLGFSRFNAKTERMLHRRIRPRYDKRCIFMYQKF